MRRSRRWKWTNITFTYSKIMIKNYLEREKGKKSRTADQKKKWKYINVVAVIDIYRFWEMMISIHRWVDAELTRKSSLHSSYTHMMIMISNDVIYFKLLNTGYTGLLIYIICTFIYILIFIIIYYYHNRPEKSSTTSYYTIMLLMFVLIVWPVWWL